MAIKTNIVDAPGLKKYPLPLSAEVHRALYIKTDLFFSLHGGSGGETIIFVYLKR